MVEVLYQILGRLTALERAVAELRDVQAQLYLPTPLHAEQERPLHPFDNKDKGNNRYRLPYDQNALPNFVGRSIYTSPAMRTKGFTHHNCFVVLEVARDTVPPDTGDHLLFTCLLEGSAGSGWVELDQVQLNSTGRTGIFPVPLLAADSLAIDTRFHLFAGDNATYEEPPPAAPRLIDLNITGVLVSGYQS